MSQGEAALKTFYWWLQYRYNLKQNQTTVDVSVLRRGIVCRNCGEHDSFENFKTCSNCTRNYCEDHYKRYYSHRCLKCDRHILKEQHISFCSKIQVRISLISLGHVSRWFHYKLSPLYRDRIDRDLKRIETCRYVEAWARALEEYTPFMLCTTGCLERAYTNDDDVEHDYSVTRFECDYFLRYHCRYSLDELMHLYKTGNYDSIASIAADKSYFGKDSKMPRLIYYTLATQTDLCERCIALNMNVYGYDGNDQFYGRDIDDDEFLDIEDHNQRRRTRQELKKQKCTCRTQYCYRVDVMLTYILHNKRKLKQEGWSWFFDGYDLNLKGPDLDHRDLTYCEELSLDYHNDYW